MRALVTGATGFIGRALVAALERPAVLTRDPERARKGLGSGAACFAWDPESGAPPAAAFEGIDAIFHLAGEPVAAGRWTPARKARIRDSRVAGTRRLVETLASLRARPRVLVAASAVGYYGDAGEAILDESAPAGRGFLGETCAAWESESGRAAALGIRVVAARIGVVLGREGGALAKMLPPFRLGLGGPIGSGRQWMPWIHRDDLVALLLHAAAREDLSGPMNAVAPAPVTNREFARALGRALRRPAFAPLPAFVLKAALGEMAGILLGSQRAVPGAAARSGFVFRHPTLEEALAAILGG